MIISRNFRDEGKEIFRIYRADTLNELNNFVKGLKEEGVNIIAFGKMSQHYINFIEGHANVEDYQDIEIKLDDLFILTQESNKNPNNNMQKNLWTEDDMSLLWSGDAESVADTIGRTLAAVNSKRNWFMERNPNFPIPPEAEYNYFGSRNKRNRTIPTGKQGHNKPWSEEEIEQLYKGSLTEVANHLGRTPGAVSLKRVEAKKRDKNRVFDKTPFKPKEVRPPNAPHNEEEKVIVSTPMTVQSPKSLPVVVEPLLDKEFKITINDQHLTMAEKPKKLTIGDITIEF